MHLLQGLECPTCKGQKFVRGLVGGVYDCPDCWTYEQKRQINYEAEKLAKNIPVKRKYVRKVDNVRSHDGHQEKS